MDLAFLHGSQAPWVSFLTLGIGVDDDDDDVHCADCEEEASGSAGLGSRARSSHLGGADEAIVSAWYRREVRSSNDGEKLIDFITTTCNLGQARLRTQEGKARIEIRHRKLVVCCITNHRCTNEAWKSRPLRVQSGIGQSNASTLAENLRHYS